MSTLSRSGRWVLDRDSSAVSTRICDGWVIFVVGTLMLLGAVMVLSASVGLEGTQVDLRRWWTTPLRQTVFAIVGFIAMIVASRLDYRLLASPSRGVSLVTVGLYGLATLALIAVLIPGVGTESLGAQRSIYVLRGSLPLSFQPSEFAKLTLVIWLAAMLSRPRVDVGSFWSGFVPVLIGSAILIGLTGIEDYGTAALMGVTTLLMLFAAGARFSHLLGLVVLGLGGGVGLLLLKPYRLERLTTFMDDECDPAGAGYQVTQSLIAIASGGWWGRGLGAGVQKYGYLPQDNNDFVFAIVCEELGIIGGLVVVALFLVLLARGGWIATRSLDPMGRLLATGMTLMICLQAAFNIAVVTNSVPTKGISLPFVSAGGSGVLFLGTAAGLLAATGRRPWPRRLSESGW